jgi:integrase
LYRSTASQVYFAHVRIGGKLFRQSLETDDRKLADRKLADFRRDKQRVDPRLGKTTLTELCDRYAETLSHLSKSSIKSKTGILKRIKAEWPGGSQKRVADIKPSDCDRWLGRQADRVGRSHANAYIQLLRDLFNFAVRDKIIGDSPAEQLKYFKREKPIRPTPTWEQFQAIVEDIRKQPFNADAEDSANFAEFLGLSGLGRAEAAALTWADINFERDQIITYRHKTATGFAVPIFPQLRPLLERLRAEGKSDASDKVFTISDAKKAIAGACKRLGLRHYSHIGFRRMFITRAIELGVDAKSLRNGKVTKTGVN